MIKASVDMKKLESSLQRYAKKFGDTTAQAVTRWGVGTCRELALETQAVKRDGKTPLQIQTMSIRAGALNVLTVVDKLTKNPKGSGYTATNQGKNYFVSSKKVLSSHAQVNWWIEKNRTGKRKWTQDKELKDRPVCAKSVFNSAIKKRIKAAGAAKGAWIGAGNDIAKAQKGEGRLSIGASFMKYAQRHAKHGSATVPRNGWNPSTKLTNKIGYSGTNHVLKSSAFPKASAWGLKKTLSWYRHALKAIDQKAK